jgi:hypothetical protein
MGNILIRPSLGVNTRKLQLYTNPRPESRFFQLNRRPFAKTKLQLRPGSLATYSARA